jgi:hypothetical protein
MTDQTTTAPAKAPRSILVQLTALDGGIVVVTPSKGPPRVVQGESAKALHELVSDPTMEQCTMEPGGDFTMRLLSIAEKVIGG